MILNQKKKVAVLLPVNLYNRISQLARETNRTIPGYIRYVLIAHIERISESA